MTQYHIPAYVIRDHLVSVPLDWNQPDGETIKVFAREVTARGRESDNLPLLVFLQGGPGGKSPRPNEGPGWLSIATKRFRVLLLDQRGTGQSSPVQGRKMATMDGETGGRYLACFRAESIIKDCERIRKTLYDGARWFTLGQSYGGFLTLSYLSFAPEALLGCYVTGGMAGINASAEDIYRHTYPRVAHKNALYFQRYPQDRAALDRLADHLETHDVRLPDDDRLTVRRLQYLGMNLGMSNGFEVIHWLLAEAFCDDGALSDSFLAAIQVETGFDHNPLFAAVHEAIYAQNGARTRWAADRILADLPAFDAKARPILFTGEMIYPWMFDDIRALHPFAAAAHALAEMPLDAPLYDTARLAANEVPVWAAVYTDDMYVDAGLSLKTARGLGNVRMWQTSEFEHNGLRQSPRVLQHLFDMEHDLAGQNHFIG
ncbi:alpha/beta hydrolase [Pseudorhodobacter turbinis]|uniref:Alpha/beta hydrolase n=1 Tax=Pseudorhodobacter turbinis TaxID=2500533 RepID=A0A4P8EFH8_9RHOB|nr:alpha/beta fold hydrolase [Pseudorhodobacter turbinis]QCO55452.1 alpha/beta hydrolase [Pseudorhodobacter turbinis]